MEEEHGGPAGDPCAMVIFGASGDLTKRKLIPALYNLAKENLLSKEFALVGFARTDMSSEQFRDKLIEDELNEFATTAVDPESVALVLRRIYYVSGEFDDPAAYREAEDPARGGGQGARHARQLLLLSGHGAGNFSAQSSRIWAQPAW